MQVARGDQSAFAGLYRTLEGHVYYCSLDILQSSAAAADAVQEIFIKVWVNREKLEGMDYFGAWLNTLIRNHLYDQLRMQAQREKILTTLVAEEKETIADNIYTEVEFRELVSLVDQAVDKLAPQQQKVFSLSRVDGMKHREIATALGISPETVKKHIMEAMRHVRSHLSAHGKSVSVLLLIRLIFP